MNVKELIEVLSGYDPEMEVVARWPHCCGRHNYRGMDDSVHIHGATDDAWWVPDVFVTRVAGYDPDTSEPVPARDVVGIEGDYPSQSREDAGSGRVDEDEWLRRMRLHRRHEASDDDGEEEGGR